MPLIKKDQSFPERAVCIVIVGTPFSYKTSLSITSKDPIIFDLEKGSERAHGRAETYRVESSWKEVEDDLSIGLLNDFKTGIIDTGGALVDDYLWDYGMVVKYTTNPMQNWGTVKDLFKKFVSKIRGSGLDLVVIAHEKSKEKKDETVYDLDISGGGKQLLLRQGDQIGFITKQDFKEAGKVLTKTILTFWPTASLPFCKNVAKLPDMVLPDCNGPDWAGFLDREVIQPTRKAIREMSEDQVKALEFIEGWQSAIDAIIPEAGKEDVTAKELLETFKGEQGVANIAEEHLKKQVSAYFLSHLKKIGWKWDKEISQFVPIVAPPVVKAEEKPAEVEKAPETKPEPPAVVNTAPPVQAESNPGGLFSPKATVDISMPRGEAAQDLVEGAEANYFDGATGEE